MLTFIRRWLDVQVIKLRLFSAESEWNAIMARGRESAQAEVARLTELQRTMLDCTERLRGITKPRRSA